MSGLSLCWALALLRPLAAGSPQPCPPACLCQERALAVNCSGANLTGRLAFPPDTERLDLSAAQLLHVPSPSLRLLWRLQVLLLGDNRIAGAGAGAFGALESLRRLDLRRNRLAALGGGFSAGLGALRELSLASNRLRALGPRDLRHCRELRELSLRDNAIAAIAPGAFRGLTRLRRLRLQNNRLRGLPDGLFSALRHLEVLDLEGNRIESLAPGAFAALRSLTLLNLARNALGRLRLRAFLAIGAPGARLLLAHNPWVCDCDLQRAFGRLRAVPWLSVDASGNVTCREPPGLRGAALALGDPQLCAAETGTVLVVTFAVCVTVVAAVVMAQRNRKRRTGRHGSADGPVAWEAPE